MSYLVFVYKEHLVKIENIKKNSKLLSCPCLTLPLPKNPIMENQDGGVGRHTAPPRTTRTDRESNSKGDQHQENRK